MSFEAWTIFALFWLVFVTTPGPNAVNCIQSGMSLGFVHALPAVAAILCQASLFLTLSGFGITALLAASPTAFLILKYAGAGFLVYLGLRAILTAHLPIKAGKHAGRSLFTRAFLIATINPKSSKACQPFRFRFKHGERVKCHPAAPCIRIDLGNSFLNRQLDAHRIV